MATKDIQGQKSQGSAFASNGLGQKMYMRKFWAHRGGLRAARSFRSTHRFREKRSTDSGTHTIPSL